MRVTYHKSALQGGDLKAFCEGLPEVDIREVDTAADLEAAAADSTVLMFNNPLYTERMAAAVAGSRVRWIQLSSTGYDALVQRGVPGSVVVTNAAAAWAPIVAEHALALTLGLLRGIPIAERDRMSSRWDRPSVLPRLSSLEGATVGILGAGAIGKEIGARVRAFGARTLYITRTPRTIELADECIPIGDVHGALPRIDILVSALPLTAETNRLVDRRWFDTMKKSALFVNVGRGSTVDEAALLASLDGGVIAGAGLDVMEVEPMAPDHPLWSSDRVIITPHVAAFNSRIGVARLLDMCRQNIERFNAGRELLNTVTLPSRAP